MVLACVRRLYSRHSLWKDAVHCHLAEALGAASQLQALRTASLAPLLGDRATDSKRAVRLVEALADSAVPVLAFLSSGNSGSSGSELGTGSRVVSKRTGAKGVIMWCTPDCSSRQRFMVMWEPMFSPELATPDKLSPADEGGEEGFSHFFNYDVLMENR